MFICLHNSEVLLCYYSIPYDVDLKENMFIALHGGSKIKFLMLQHTKSVSGVEIVLLNHIFSVIRSDFHILSSLECLISLVPTVRWI